MAVPNSTLQTFRICGFVEDACGEPARGRITVTMVNPDRGPVCDPTNGALVNSGNVQNESWEDGCWCTCELFPSSAADPDAALQPNTTAYNIVVNSGGSDILDITIPINVEEFAALPVTTSDCGPCVNIKDLINFTPSQPPSNQFCNAVEACLQDLITTTGAVTGVEVDPDQTCALLVTTDEGTSSVDLSAAIAACAPVPASVADVVIDPDQTCGILVTYTDGSPATPLDLSAAIAACAPAGTSGVANVVIDPGQTCGLLVSFSDGSPSVSIDLSAAIAACSTGGTGAVGSLTEDGNGNIVYTPGDGSPVQTVAVCDLIGVLPQGPAPADVLVLGFDPLTGECGLHPGCNDTFTTADINGAGDLVITMPDGSAPIVYSGGGAGTATADCGVFVAWQADATDPTACTPAARTECTDVAGFTISPDGTRWVSAAGSPGWTKAISTPQVITTTANQFHSPLTGAAVDAACGTELINVSATITNPYCTPMFVLAEYRPGNWRFCFDGDLRQKMEVQITTDLGYSPVIGVEQSGPLNPEPGVLSCHVFGASNEFGTVIVPPGGSHTANLTTTLVCGPFNSDDNNLVSGAMSEITLIGWPIGN